MPAPNVPHVAGTQEQYPAPPGAKPGYAPLVVATITDKGLTVSPNRIPPGSFNVKVVNGSSHPQIVTLTGKGMQQVTPSLKPGGDVTFAVQNLHPGTFKFSNVKSTGIAHHDTDLKVAEGAPWPTTSVPSPHQPGTLAPPIAPTTK